MKLFVLLLIADSLQLSAKNYEQQVSVRENNAPIAKVLGPKAELLPSVHITGTVRDSTTGNPLAGVTIKVKRESLGTITDVNGKFSLVVPDNAVLIVSYLGYNPKSISVGDRRKFNIFLSTTATGLNQLVVIGYGTQKKGDLTGSISVVNTQELNNQPTDGIIKQLQGLASGVTVVSSGQPGEEPTIRIRGINTFGNNNPLYIVDGIPTQNISNISSQDIATLQVLKDASAASIYGSRAANGVIIITTKKGEKGIHLSYNGSIGLKVPPSGNVFNILNPKEQANLKWLALKNSGVTNISDPLYGSGKEPTVPDYILPSGASDGDPSVDPSLYYVNPHYTNISDLNNFYQIVRANKSGTNWFGKLFNPSIKTRHNLSIDGGTDNSKYLFSLNYQNNQGNIKYTYLKRYGIRANTQFNIGNNFRIGENMQYTITSNPKVSTLSGGSPINFAAQMPSIVPVYDIMGNFAGSAPPGLGRAVNPIAQVYRTRNNSSQINTLFGNIYAELDLFKHFTLRSNFGGTIESVNGTEFNYPTYEKSENSPSNGYSESSNKNYNWNWSNTVDYKNTFGKHNLEVLAGLESNYTHIHLFSASRNDYYSFSPDFVNLSTGSGTPTVESSTIETGLFSLFGRVDYNYDGKYLISTTLRRDGSSKFVNNKFGVFPAVSLGWVISKEAFMQDILWISNLKLRAGWGIMGNQLNVDPNNSFTSYSGDNTSTYYSLTGSNSSIIQGFTKTRIGNPDAKWEKDINKNIGLDLSLLDSKLEIIIDYYRKKISGLLYEAELPGTAGAAQVPSINIAQVNNKGLDLSVIYNFNFNKDFLAQVGGNLSHYNNIIKRVSDGSNFFGNYARRFSSSIVRNEVGHSIGQFYGYKIVGFWDSKDEIKEANKVAQENTGNSSVVYQQGIGLGRFRYKDINNDGQITAEDRTFIGDPNPDFTYGVNLSFKYKQIDLRMFFYGSQGNDIWNQIKWWTDFYAAFQGAKSKTALYDSWTPNHKNAKVAIQESNSSFSTNTVPTSYFVENGSFLKLKSLQLGYNFSPKVLSKIGLKKLRIYLQGANLFTITKYSGLDPEVGSVNTTIFGIDEGDYVTSRQFILGISLNY